MERSNCEICQLFILVIKEKLECLGKQGRVAYALMYKTFIQDLINRNNFKLLYENEKVFYT